MKSLLIPAIVGVLLLSACAPRELLQQQAKEDQALITLHKAERQEARANSVAAAAKTTSAAATQSAKASKQQTDEARKAFSDAVCPVGGE